MKKTHSYRHGNLSNEFIKQVIAIVNDEDEQALSVRKAAASYAHFKNKEQLLSACREDVSKQCADFLSDSITGKDITKPKTLNIFGNAYVEFFNPFSCSLFAIA